MKRKLFPKKFLSLIMLLFIMLFYSCNNLPTNPTHDTEIKYFPNKIGNSWKYFFYDSLAHSTDTVIVTIIGKAVFGQNRTAKIWQYHYINKNDTVYRYVETSKDTVRIAYHLRNLEKPYSIFLILPLSPYKSWNAGCSCNTFTVLNKNSISVNAGNFNECYLINEEVYSGDTVEKIKYWFVPYVGIVKEHFKAAYMSFSKDYWELLEYNVK